MFYYERYEARDKMSDVRSIQEEGRQSLQAVPGLVPDVPAPDRDFGTRIHQLLCQYRLGLMGKNIPEYPEWPDPQIEAEAQATFARYIANYPVEPLEFLSVERTEAVRIPGTPHELVVKLDGFVRHEDRTCGPLDTKSEKHGSKSNTRESWAGRTQAALYLYASQRLYPQETVSRMVVDVITRGSPKFPPAFRRVDDISQSPEQLEEAIRNVARVADEIEEAQRTGFWYANKNSCTEWTGRLCDFYPLHILGRTEGNLKLYKPAEAYLDESLS